MSSDISDIIEIKYFCHDCKHSTNIMTGLKCSQCKSDFVQEIDSNASFITVPDVTTDSADETTEENKLMVSIKICSICLEEMITDGNENQTLEKCKHIFHRECVKTWLQNQLTCPLCRVKATTEEIAKASDPSLKTSGILESIQSSLGELTRQMNTGIMVNVLNDESNHSRMLRRLNRNVARIQALVPQMESHNGTDDNNFTNLLPPEEHSIRHFHQFPRVSVRLTQLRRPRRMRSQTATSTVSRVDYQ